LKLATGGVGLALSDLVDAREPKAAAASVKLKGATEVVSATRTKPQAYGGDPLPEPVFHHSPREPPRSGSHTSVAPA